MSLELHKHLSKKQEITIVDRLMSIASVLHPLSAVPQIVKIYSEKSGAGVSLPTWAGFAVLGLIFLAYGIVHKLKPFIVMQILWLIVDVLVVVGVLIYS